MPYIGFMDTETPNPRAFLYSRVSTPDQAKGHTMERQTKAAIAYAKENGLDLLERPFGDKPFTDAGKSGYHAHHIASGQFGLFLKSLPEPAGDGTIRRGDYLLIEAIDRMGRTPPNEAQEIFLRITNNGVNIVTFEPNQPPKVYKNPVNYMDLQYTLMKMELAYLESARKAGLIKATLDEKEKMVAAGLIKKGGRRWPWLKPIKQLIPGMRFPQTVGYELDTDRAKIITKMFRLNVKDYGNLRIAKKLEADGDKPFRGKSSRWSLSTIGHYLNTPAVIGHGYPYGELDENYYPPIPAIVKEDLYYQSRTVRAAKRVGTGHFTIDEKGQKGGGPIINKANNLFQGLAFCLHCGETMRYRDKTSGAMWTEKQARKTKKARARKAKVYLGCVNRDCSDRPSWNYNLFETTFIQQCGVLEIGRMVRTDEQTKARQQLDAKIKAADGRMAIATLERDNAQASSRQAKNERMRERHTDDGDKAQDKIDKLEAELTDMKARAEAYDKEMNNFHNNAEKMEEALGKLQDRRRKDNPELRFQASRIIAAVVRKIELRGEQPDEAMPEPYYFVTFRNGDIRRIVVDKKGKVISHTFETSDYERLRDENQAGDITSKEE
jgi:DNA invertase Pin-like site-specific DNA recombinase